MRKKIIISSIILLLLVAIIIISYVLTNKHKTVDIATNNTTVTETLKIIPIPENIDDTQIILTSAAEARFMTDMTDNEVIGDKADFIIIGTIKSIDGVVNYNPTTKTYTMAQTVGKLKIDKILKGNINEKQISFIRLGGIIPLSEYEKSLQPTQVERRGLNELTQKEKENKYISEGFEGDIQVEKNKTYLMYLTYDTDYNMYYIIYLQYGLKEIDPNSLSSDPSISNSDTETLTSNEYKSIKVKNNTNGNYDTLDSIIPDKVKKIK